MSLFLLSTIHFYYDGVAADVLEVLLSVIPPAVRCENMICHGWTDPLNPLLKPPVGGEFSFQKTHGWRFILPQAPPNCWIRHYIKKWIHIGLTPPNHNILIISSVWEPPAPVWPLRSSLTTICGKWDPSKPSSFIPWTVKEPLKVLFLPCNSNHSWITSPAAVLLMSCLTSLLVLQPGSAHTWSQTEYISTSIATFYKRSFITSTCDIWQS